MVGQNEESEYFTKYKEGNNHPSFVNKISLVHNPDKAMYVINYFLSYPSKVRYHVNIELRCM